MQDFLPIYVALGKKGVHQPDADRMELDYVAHLLGMKPEQPLPSPENWGRTPEARAEMERTMRGTVW